AGYERGRREPDLPEPVWPPAACPAWCMYADDPADHVSDIGAERQPDRTHVHSCQVHQDQQLAAGDQVADEPGSVPLSLEKPWAGGGPSKPWFFHQRIHSELSRHYRHGWPEVSLVHLAGGEGRVLRLTLAEAQAIADHLTHLVELGRQG
ncbi:MAG: hypothetical protein ACRDT2_03340, partial [Natronosporangium sp.]